ncbi:translocation protein SEC62 [Hetaerina americana]|uniref:translocation protein SEC62 n=1 Tax=Hetaerina americana TaxID=62018 RepID=UPI003A7F43D2
MAEKRKGKKRKEEFPLDKPDKPTKEEYAVAKWVRKNVPKKRTKFLNHNVEYFTACKAIDALMTSRWAQAKEGEEPLFSTRQDVVEFMDKMLRHKFFHRAKKIPVSEQELKAKSKKKEKDKKKDDDKKKKEEERRDEAESSHTERDKKDDRMDDKDKKKRKIRLEMHLEQIFADGWDAYVWIYDPIPVYYWFFGSLLVIGAIAICLFPLWPPTVRKGVYYLSLAAAGFLILIIALTVLRLVIFCLIWVITFGKHHLWVFPNLTEDVGFWASFWPLWQYEYKGEGNGEKEKKKKKDKDSDNEDEPSAEENGDKESAEKAEQESTAVEDDHSEKEQDHSESESESSQKSQTGKDFEMVEKEEVES